MCETKKQQRGSTDKIEAMKDKLELQLHEQYAINNNANVSSFIAMITALLIAFTGYGYVLYQYLMGDVCCSHTSDAETMVHIATFAVLIVVFILYVVAIEIGAGQRSNQLVIFAIRKKAYNNASDYKVTFPKGYHPFNKQCHNFVQGIYNIMSFVFLGVYIAIPICSCVALCWNCCWGYVVYVAILGVMICFRCRKFCDYNEAQTLFQTIIKEQEVEAVKDVPSPSKFEEYFDASELTK